MEMLNTPALLGFFKRYPNFPSGIVIREVSSGAMLETCGSAGNAGWFTGKEVSW